MKALLYVEIDLEFCVHEYGVAPCTASLGSPATGTMKCFNSRNTCQDLANFNVFNSFSPPVEGDLFTLRFARESGYLPREIAAVPNLADLNFSPGTLSLGKDLGARASLTLTFRDHKWADTGGGFDKYFSERGYDPFEQGTFWAKFRARQPFLRGRAIRVIRGGLPESIAERWEQGTALGDVLIDQETRHYIVDSFNYSIGDGRFTITAKDVLKLASGDRAQAPRLSTGVLSAAINSSTTAATLSPAGVGNEEYPASGHVAIGGKEIVSFTRSADALTITRAQMNTVAQAHDEDDRVQLVLQYVTEDPAVIIADLLQNYAGVDPDFIPLSQWQFETATNLGRFYSAVIAEPTGVDKLLAEIMEQAALILWWDDLAQLISLLVLRPVSPGSIVIGQDKILQGSLSSSEQPEKRETQIWTYYGQINPLAKVDEAENYRSVAIDVDLTAEENYGSPAIKKIFARWIPAFGIPVIAKMNALRLARFTDPPRKISFSLFRDGDYVPATGASLLLEGWALQDAAGAAIRLPVQITRVDPKTDRFDLEAEEMLLADAGSDLEDDDMPIGAIIDFAGDTPPEGWLLCDGSAINRATFSDLFDVIGETYGPGNGSTTFNIPDCKGRVTAGRDDMGGSAANRLTNTGTGNPGINGAQLGASGGVDRRGLSQAELPGVTLSVSGRTSPGSGALLVQGADGGSPPVSIAGVPLGGSSHAHPIVQPTIVFNKIIRATEPA